MHELMQFIPQELLILLMCTPIVGEMLKVSAHTEKIIPIVLFGFDIIFSILLLRSWEPIVILQGIAVWGIALASYDLTKTVKKMRGSE